MIPREQATWPAAARRGSGRQRPEAVAVAVPARLHLGLLDLEGGLGRRFGSFGVTLEGPRTRLVATPAQGLGAEGPDAARVQAYMAETVRHFGLETGLEGGCRIRIEEAIPAHSGLGSGTQLALATGAAVCALAGVEVPPRVLAEALDRGRRSGVGIGAFEQGGVLLDGGKGQDSRPPPLICRMPFPADWRILLLLDGNHDGLHGAEEVAAFAALPPFPEAQAAQLCRRVLLGALPALAEGDIAGFGAAVSELQRVIGDHFAPAQGGRFASPRVAAALAWLDGAGVPGLGQSSWGPTGFALAASEGEGRRLLDGLRASGAAEDLELRLCQGRNRGATVERAAAAVLAAEP